MKEISNKEYKIFYGDDVLEKLTETLIAKAYSKVFVLVDENTEKYCWPLLSTYLVDTRIIKIESGETNKNLKTAQFIWEFLQENLADRRSVLINLGGGVLSDIGGFCAATYKRGIDFINIPTTLLGMVDAAIGGKLGVDVQSFKNAVGVFKHPVLICIYPDFIKTLPEIELKNGLAELAKHALIANKDLWSKIIKYQTISFDWVSAVMLDSIKIKYQIVKKDPLESGLRKVLNFGHTIGHAIETISLKKDENPLKHGQAIAAGIICEAFLSKHLLDLSGKELKQITQFYLNLFGKLKISEDVTELLYIMLNDKKNEDGNINFSLIKKIGKSKYDVKCPKELILSSMDYYYQL